MPNHLHGILLIHNLGGGEERSEVSQKEFPSSASCLQPNEESMQAIYTVMPDERVLEIHQE